MLRTTLAIAALAASASMAAELPAENQLQGLDRFLAEDAADILMKDGDQNGEGDQGET